MHPQHLSAFLKSNLNQFSKASGRRRHGAGAVTIYMLVPDGTRDQLQSYLL
jgi:hypothetical protein